MARPHQGTSYSSSMHASHWSGQVNVASMVLGKVTGLNWCTWPVLTILLRALVQAPVIHGRFYSWVAGTMGVKFLAQGSNSSRLGCHSRASNLGPFDYQQGRRQGGATGAFCPGPHLVGGPRQGPLLPLSYTCTKDRNTLIEQSP